MPVKSLVRRSTSPTRGRHLLANDKIQKGQLIFCERPLVALQSTGNVHSGALVCHYCMAFCGSPAQALQIAADPTRLQEITTSDPLPEQQNGDHALIPCQHKCGQVYCSIECQQDDWEWGGHKELCTGWIDDANHPLVRFRHHAIQSNEIFLLIGKWLARIHNQNVPYHEDDCSLDLHPLVDFSMNLWWDVATLPFVNDLMRCAEVIALNRSCRRLCEESQALLESAWPEYKGSPWLTPIGFAKLIGSLEQNCIGVRRKHPLRQNIMDDTDLRHAHHKELIKCLEKAGMIGDGDEEEDEGCEALDGDGGDLDDYETSKIQVQDNVDREEEEEAYPPSKSEDDWDYSPDEIAEFLSNLSHPMNIGSDDEWDAIFTPLDGTAHFAMTEKMNHSCEPNVVILYKSRGWGKNHPLVAYCIALRDIEPNEELTIAYIETDETYDARQKALANYGFVCTCPKCEREKSGSTYRTSLRICLQCPVKQEEPTESLEGIHQDNPNNDCEDDRDVFGSDGEENDSVKDDNSNELPQQDNGLDGDAKLKNAAEQMESIWNKSNYATIPLQYLAPVANYITQLAGSLIKKPGGLEIEKEQVIQHLVEQCLNGARERDFSLCRIVGPELERRLYRSLQSNGSFTCPEARDAYWCGCCTAAMGLAQDGSFLLALQNLDKASILGLKRVSLGEFLPYVELLASQMSATPCPHAIHCVIPDFEAPELRLQVTSTSLSVPITSPVKEVSCDSDFFGNLIKGQSEPMIVRRLASHWPATTKWRNMESLSRIQGHRLVPIEVGSISSGMTEQLLSFRAFISTYLAQSNHTISWSLDDASNPSSRIAYLAQHPLLEQIPELYQDVEQSPCGIEPTNVNAWIGTGGTRTPLHFDSYDNMLIQLVGAKYVRLYDPKETGRLYVSSDKKYGLQGNMSEVDCELEDFAKHPLCKDAVYTEVILFPGDCLYIPSRHWHYVRSLSTSASVNYWF